MKELTPFVKRLDLRLPDLSLRFSIPNPQTGKSFTLWLRTQLGTGSFL